MSSNGANIPRFIPGNSPGLFHESRQDNAVVTDSIYAGAPFEAVANENHVTTNVLDNYTVKKCNRSGCFNL